MSRRLAGERTLAARVLLVSAALVAMQGCSAARSSAETDNTVTAGLDSLNVQLAESYRRRDPSAYAALYTDSAVFEWPGIAPVRGPAALGDMVREMWSSERDVELRLRVSARRVAEDHASEFGAFEQSWRDSSGVMRTEFGRYASLLVRNADGVWRLDRFLGFEDSTAVVQAAR